MTTGANSAPQLTLKAILLSIILTVILASGNAYVGLFAGLTVATAIPAAVILFYHAPAAQWIAAALLFGICCWVFRVGTPRTSK